MEVVVKGCGLSEVNGAYKRDGTLSSPVFIKVYSGRGNILIKKSIVLG